MSNPESREYSTQDQDAIEVDAVGIIARFWCERDDGEDFGRRLRLT